jgi:PAS domain S-box-containing protein
MTSGTRFAADAERRRLAAIVARTDAAIITKGLDGLITSWNAGATSLLGYEAAEVIGHSIRLIIPAHLYDEEEEVVGRLCAGQPVEAYETAWLRKDGLAVDVSVRVSAVSAADGTVLEIASIARDIAQQRRLERDAQHFSAIVESSEDAIIGTDLTGTIVSWNRAAVRLFGSTAAEMIGQSIQEIIPSERQTEEEEMFRRVSRGEMVDHFETYRRRTNGTLVPVSLTLSPIRSLAGEIIGASTIGRDLTRTWRVQRDALRLAAIVESTDDAIVGKDLNGIVFSWNPAAERLFGFTADEMIGQSIRRIIPEHRQSEEDHVLSRIRSGQRVEHYETIRQHKDGTLRSVSLTVSPIRNQDGTVIGASKIARDIGERQRADEERRRLLTIARDASQLRDEFLATLSHELRTPLNAVVGYLRMIQAGLLNEEKRAQAVETAARNATSLTQIVEDILDVSRIISGKIRLNVQAVDLSTIVRDVLDTVRPGADAKDLRLQAILDPRTPPVSGDPERLRQILWNLCTNAVKFTNRGGRIEVRLEQVNSHVELTVTDTGIGIAADFLPHVFDRFRQAESAIGRLHGGLGLGLAISRHLIESQGGRIFAHSRGPGQGSTFRIELPIRSVHHVEDAAERLHPRAPSASRINIPALDGFTVLAVDDDRDTLALIREILETTGATVVTADSGRQALEKILRLPVDALIADIGMPGMNGFELIEHVRSSEQIDVRSIPAAALTAFARSEDRTEALRRGFHIHLSKPIEPSELMAAVARLLDTQRNR